MTRLIDADELQSEYKKYHDGKRSVLIDTAPTVDAVPVRHGKWIRTGRTNIYGGYELQCPLCGDKVMVQNIECELYCRNCGARMDAERKE